MLNSRSRHSPSCIVDFNSRCTVEVTIWYIREADAHYSGLNVGSGSWYNASYRGRGVKEVCTS